MSCTKRVFLLLFSFFLACNFAKAQSVSGVSGYVRIPTATFNEDRSLYFGTSFLPQKYLSYTNYNRNAMAFFASLTFLPFLEVDFRLTRQLQISEETTHTVDRMPSIRLRLLKEKKWLPAVVLGTHDILSSLDGSVARHFNATYIVCSKNKSFENLSLNIEGSLGYAVDLFDSGKLDMQGFFGGIAIGSQNFDWIDLMLDYDSKTVNTGVRLTAFKHFHFLIGLQKFNALTGAISYQFSL